MEINLILAIIILTSLFLIVPTFAIVVFFNNKKILKNLGIVFFVFYLVGLFVLVLGQVNLVGEKVTLYFYTDSKWFNIYFLWADFGKINILINLFMLFPVSGFVFSQTENKCLLKTILLSFLISLLIETTQFILPINRCTEVFDIVLNVCSGIIGYTYFCLLFKIIKKIKKS